MERVKGIEPSLLVEWFIVFNNIVSIGLFALILVLILALLALAVAYLYRKARSPFWYVVFFDSDQKERHRSTGLRANDPTDTAKAKALRAELEAKEHHRAPLINREGWDTWAPKYLERHCESSRTLER